MSRKFPPLMDRLVAKLYTDEDTGCWIYTGGMTRHGYGLIAGGELNDGRKLLTHRVSYEFFVGAVPAGLDIDHLCRVRHCCNPKHMEPVSRKLNIWRGLGSGETQNTAKLNRFQVKNIREMAAHGWRLSALADMFDVHRSTIWAIVNQKTWAHLLHEDTVNHASIVNSQ